jgi:hypothetical protein
LSVGKTAGHVALAHCDKSRSEFPQTISKFPGRVMFLELSDIADPPHVVANTVGFFVGSSYFACANLFTKGESLRASNSSFAARRQC